MKLIELFEAIDLGGREKLWINPKLGKTIDVRGSHHTVHAYEHPQKYGLPGGIFANYTPEIVDNNAPTLYDNYIAEVLYDAEANLQGIDFETVAKALHWLRKNNRHFMKVFVATIDDYVMLDTPNMIKRFCRTGKKPEANQLQQFREEQITELNRNAQLDDQNVDELEDYLNATLFQPKSHIKKGEPVINIDLDKSDHFMDRAKERDMSVSDVERTVKKGYRQNWNWLRQKAKDNDIRNKSDGQHFIDPEKNIDIPMNLAKTPGIPKTNRKDGKSVAKLGKKAVPKNTIYPKTIINRAISKDGSPHNPNKDTKWRNIKKNLGYK